MLGDAFYKQFNNNYDLKCTDDFIINWLKENTTFKHINNLGKDEDNIPPFEGYYGRTLFACIR